MDAVAQTPFPAVVRGGAGEGHRVEGIRKTEGARREELKEHWGVVAELYKLNVCASFSNCHSISC